MQALACELQLQGSWRMHRASSISFGYCTCMEDVGMLNGLILLLQGRRSSLAAQLQTVMLMLGNRRSIWLLFLVIRQVSTYRMTIIAYEILSSYGLGVKLLLYISKRCETAGCAQYVYDLNRHVALFVLVQQVTHSFEMIFCVRCQGCPRMNSEIPNTVIERTIVRICAALGCAVYNKHSDVHAALSQCSELFAIGLGETYPY